MSTNVKIEQKLLNEIIKIAKKENTTEQQLLTEIIKEAIEIINKETTFDRLKRLTDGKINS